MAASCSLSRSTATRGKIVFDLKLFDVATPQYAHPFNTYASPTPVIEPGRVYVTFGVAGHRRDRHQDRQGHLGAPRLRVQSFPRRRLVADHLRGLAAHALRRQRPPVRRRTRQAHGQDGLADGRGRSISRISVRMASRRRTAISARRFATPQIVMVDGPSGDGEHRIEGGLRLRPADRQGALESHRARQPLGQRAAGGRARSRLRADGVRRGAAARRSARRARRRRRAPTSRGASAKARRASRRSSWSAT